MGGFIRHDRPLAAYQHLGRQEAFQCVGEVAFTQEPRERSKIKASAVLIAPEWALTAGHVAAKTDLEKQRYTFGGEQYRGIRRILHPDFDPDAPQVEDKLENIAAGVDLALVQLDRPVANVTPAARYHGENEVGQTMVAIGCGVVGYGTTGRPVLPLTQERLGGRNVIDAAGATLGDLTVTERVLLCDFDAPSDSTRNRLGKPVSLDLEVSGSPGDSGGGWFIRVGCSWRLVAVHSGAVPPTGDPYDAPPSRFGYGAIAAGMRVSKANDWIDAVIGRVPSGDFSRCPGSRNEIRDRTSIPVAERHVGR